MKLFSEKVSYTSTSSPFNIIQVEDYNEIFFGVYEIEINNTKYAVERVSEHNGSPVVSIPVNVDGEEKEYSFILAKGDFEIFFNEDSENRGLSEIKYGAEEDSLVIEDVIDVDSIEDEIIVEERDIIQEKIEHAKNAAKKIVERANDQKKRFIEEENKKSKLQLEQTIAKAKDELVDEFVKLTNSLKEEVISERDSLLESRVEAVRKTLSRVISKDFDTAFVEFDKSVRSLAFEHFSSLEPVIESKIQTSENNLEEKIVNVKSAIDKSFEVISEENVNILNKVNSSVNKALSRIGNTNLKLDESIRDIEEKVQAKIKDTEKLIHDKISEIKEETLSIEEKDNLVKLIENFQADINNDINEFKKQHVITEKNNNDAKSLKKLENKLNEKLQAEILHLKKYVASYSGGGGSVAVQYGNGGVMNGDLTVNGTINAQSINISSPDSSDFIQQKVYRDQLATGENNTQTFPIGISPSLTNVKLFISYISPTKKTATEAFVMHMDTSCFINVYSVINSDNSNPLLLNVSCNTNNGVLNVVSNVSENCNVIISGIATYADDTNGVLFTP